MKDKKIDSEGRIISRAINMTRKKAPDNLKHRVMHQIMQEEALKQKSQASTKYKTTNVLKDFLGIFGVMYAVLAVLVVGAYVLKGKDFLISSQFLLPVFFVCFVFSIFGLIITIDSRRKYR